MRNGVGSPALTVAAGLSLHAHVGLLVMFCRPAAFHASPVFFVCPLDSGGHRTDTPTGADSRPEGHMMRDAPRYPSGFT